MTKNKALQLALDALHGFIPYLPLDSNKPQCDKYDQAITAIKKALETKDEPVAWRYKPVREDNPRWEYTTQHPLDMGDGYIRPSLVEYCKCIEPLYAKKKPKLMLEKFKEMESLLDEPPQRTWVGLTQEEFEKLINDAGFTRSDLLMMGACVEEIVYLVEANLKKKNT